MYFLTEELELKIITIKIPTLIRLLLNHFQLKNKINHYREHIKSILKPKRILIFLKKELKKGIRNFRLIPIIVKDSNTILN